VAGPRVRPDAHRALGLAEIPPELREGLGEIEAAAAGSLPVLLETGQLRGLLHCHTNYSDGSNTVEEIARACRAAGYSYVGITDHSQAAAYAGGLGSEDLARQADEVDAVNGRLEGIRVLKGIEADILVDGRIDYDDAVLERLDFVIASIHSRFNLNLQEMTNRVLAAMDNRCVTIIGHPTGRLLLSRDPYGIDLDAVFAKAAASGVAMEINADPHRLDLDWRVLRQARSMGVTISIGADAHNVSGISNVEYGVGMARKGWLGAGDILNARPVDEFLAFAAKRRRA
jgi:DNA polymerase (family 10)